MTGYRSITAFFILLFSTICGGWLHGSLTNRWGAPSNSNRAADAFRRSLPVEIGNWRMRSEMPFSAEVIQILQCPAYINRVYEHQQTGDVVRVAVIVGPPGPISVHTPEMCYSSRDFSLAGDRRKISVKDAHGENHTLWDVPFEANDLEGGSLRALYGWSTGTVFEAAQRPRFGYGGLTHLYKIQLAISSNSRSQSNQFDPADDFLINFLAQLNPLLVDASR